MGKIFVVAGELSGDMHAARVIREIKKIKPDIKLTGFGSSNLKKQGVKILVDPTTINSIGFSAALKNYKTHLKHLKILKGYIDQDKPDVLFLVDYSGFNMLVAKMAARRGIPVVNYFAPSAWIWGKWRARWMARSGAKIAAVFPMELDVYRRAGADIRYVGHPLLDMINIEDSEVEIYKNLDLDSEKKIIALLPGSRQYEIETLLPPMLKAASRLQEQNRELQFVIPLADNADYDRIMKMICSHKLISRVIANYTRESIYIADLAVVASGTATLEAAILKTPMVIVYKTSWLNYQLGRKLLKKDHIGLPNIIAAREIVPELLQDDLTPEKIFQKVKMNKYICLVQ